MNKTVSYDLMKIMKAIRRKENCTFKTNLSNTKKESQVE